MRKAIKENKSATRAEIVNITKISVTTVRTLLTEMLENDEIFEAGQDESIGGRKALRYALNKNRFLGVALCLDIMCIHYIKINMCAEICENGSFDIENTIVESLCTFLDTLFAKADIKSIGIGVPGIVNDIGYQRKNDGGELEDYPIGTLLNQRYGVPVVLENDLNAIALGFGRRYLNQFTEVHCTDVHMAYIHFDRECISSGFLSNGKILRGWNNFSGELGLFPVDDSQTLDELMSLSLENEQYARIVAKLIAGICCVLNPQYVALGGEQFRQKCLPLIIECFKGMLPDKMSAQIMYAQDKWHDYFTGMAYLTAEHICAQVVLIKEE